MNLWHFCCLFRRTNTGCAPLLHYLILSPKIQSAMTGLVRYVVLCSLCCLLVPLSFWLFDSLYLKLAQTSKESSLGYIWETKEKGRAKRQKKNDKKEKEREEWTGKQMTWRERVAADGGQFYTVSLLTISH